MKFVPAFNAATTSVVPPEWRFAHRAALPVIVVYDRNGQWSSPRCGLMEQPEPLPSALASHAWPEVAIRSTRAGWFMFGWLPSSDAPNVLAPQVAMEFDGDGLVMLAQRGGDESRSARC